VTRWIDPDDVEPREILRSAALDGKRMLEIGSG
jgi:hypothetical protein